MQLHCRPWTQKQSSHGQPEHTRNKCHCCRFSLLLGSTRKAGRSTPALTGWWTASHSHINWEAGFLKAKVRESSWKLLLRVCNRLWYGGYSWAHVKDYTRCQIIDSGLSLLNHSFFFFIFLKQESKSMTNIFETSSHCSPYLSFLCYLCDHTWFFCSRNRGRLPWVSWIYGLQWNISCKRMNLEATAKKANSDCKTK